jgi:hypothetical protein
VHCDGYFSGVGYCLQQMLVKKTAVNKENAEDCVCMMLQEDNDFEPTFYPHSDIEYFYIIDFDSNVFSGWRTHCVNAWGDAKDKWLESLPRVDEESKVDLLNDNLLKKER